MDNEFFSKPILNSPYAYPARHWELDDKGQPTQQIIETRRRAEFITPIPKPKKRKGAAPQQIQLFEFEANDSISSSDQRYDPTPIINELRYHVDAWRKLANPQDWLVTPETSRLLQHWRSYQFNGVRPFFCQVEAVETAIWLTEVAPKMGKIGKKFLTHLETANQNANPELMRLALKLATGAGKTTVMAMIIAWQTINAVHKPNSKTFTPRLFDRHPRTDHSGPSAGSATQRSRQLLPKPRNSTQRHAVGHGTGQNRHYQLSRLQVA